MHFLMTVDVESFSIPLNKCDEKTAVEVSRTGLPRLLDLLSKHDLPATFYFTGEFAGLSPESILAVKEHGHEIGCHGYYHEPERAFDLLSYEEQMKDLTMAKQLIESIAGPIESFRAPALRINEDTVRALDAAGFTSDSSVCPQRFDGPFTFGSKKKLKWLVAPRKPYYLDGKSRILEIPISALIVPFIGTTMRISPSFIRGLAKVLFLESQVTGKPVVFLFHPNECIEHSGAISPFQRTSNPIHYFFADYLRQRLKLKNLGMKAIDLMDGILSEAGESGAQFLTASAYRKYYR